MKIKLLFVLLFLLFTYAYAQDINSDSLKFEIDSLKVDSVIKPNSSSNISFFEKYQSLFGSIIGAFFASLIAVYSIKKTYKNQILLENKKTHNSMCIEEKIYSGFLFSVYSTLLSHKEISKALKGELNTIVKNVEHTGVLSIEKPYNRYSVDILKQCLLKSLSYENYDSDTIMYLVTYVNKLEDFDSNLNFLPLSKIREQYKNNVEYTKTVKIYFSGLLGRIGILDELNDKITNLILNFLHNSKVVNMQEHL